MSTLQWFNEVRRNGNVLRWHTEPTIGPQSVAEHSWGVMMLAGRLTDWDSPHVLIAAAVHDLAEYHCGDTPAQVKWASPEIKTALDKIEGEVLWRLGVCTTLTQDEEELLHCCDYLEAMHHCLLRVQAGCQQARLPFKRMEERLVDRLASMAPGEADWRRLARNMLVDLVLDMGDER